MAWEMGDDDGWTVVSRAKKGKAGKSTPPRRAAPPPCSKGCCGQEGGWVEEEDEVDGEEIDEKEVSRWRERVTRKREEIQQSGMVGLSV